MSTKHIVEIYVGGALLSAFISGFVFNKEDREGIPVYVVWLWPLLVLVGIVAVPVWLPEKLQQTALWIKHKWEARQAIKKLFSDCGKPHD